MYYRKQDFFDTPEGVEIKKILTLIDNSEDYNSSPSYSPNTEVYGDNLIPFVDKHMAYIRSHPALNAMQYISNLKIVSRKSRLIR
jgi:hypothetical protein